jgi:hypothetical protein
MLADDGQFDPGHEALLQKAKAASRKDAKPQREATTKIFEAVLGVFAALREEASGL